MRYSMGLVTGATLAVLAFLAWKSRLAGEVIRAWTSRGDPVRYRHHIRWRR